MHLSLSWNVLEFWQIKCFRFIIICITSDYVYNMTLEYFSWSLKQWVYLILLLGAFAKLRKETFSFVMSVSPSVQNNWAPTGWIFMKLYIWVFLKNVWRKFPYDLTRIMGTSQECICTFMISHSVLLRMRSVSEKKF